MRLSWPPSIAPGLRAVAGGALVLALVAGGCAVKSAEPMAPSSEAAPAAAPALDAFEGSREAPPAQAPAPSSAGDEADPAVALAEAEDALDRALRGAPASPAPARADGKKAEARDGATPQAESGDGCEVACRALASMRRSADRLCELAASGDAGRCGDARARVTRAEGRVKERCPACHAEGPP